MKILFIKPSIKELYLEFKESAPEYPPLGLAYMAALLEKEGHEVKILDLSVENMGREKLAKFVYKFNPEIVGFGVVTPTAESAYNLIDYLKTKFGNIIFIIGGPHVTSLPEEALQHADVVFRGESENTISKFVRAIKNKKNYRNIDGISFIYNKKFVHNKPAKLIENLNELPYPARHLLPMDKYKYLSGSNARITNIMMSRGCPFRCNYCNKNIFGLRVRGRSVENIIGEIDELVNKYKIKEIHISDDTFNYDKEKTILLCKEIIKRKYDIKFFADGGIRVHTADSKLFDYLIKAGFVSMAFGVESGNQQILNNVHKGITPHQSRRAFKLAHKAGFEEIIGYFMLGLKGETVETARDTIKLAIELNPTIAKFHIVVPYPGTEYYNELKAQDRIRVKRWFDYAIYSEPTFQPENLTIKQLIGLQKEAYKKFYFRPRSMYNLIRRVSKDWDRGLVYLKLGISTLNLINNR